MTNTPIISIIMPCYNAATHLPISVGSVQEQTRADWELLIVDDGSKDDSWQVIRSMAAQDPRIRPFRQDNAGAAAARNIALVQANGLVTAFLDSDDTWHPDFLQIMLGALDSHPDAGLAYCGWQNIGLGPGRDDPFIPPDYETPDKTEALLGGCRWPIHGALTRTRLIHAAGGFDESLSSCMDYDLWLRLGTQHRLLRVPHVLAYYHHHGGEQITRNRVRIALNHWRAQRKFVDTHPHVARMLGRRRLRELMVGELLCRAYTSYWKRDLTTARALFRVVMKHGYGTLRDWRYMLPALLPERWYRALVQWRDAHSDPN